MKNVIISLSVLFSLVSFTSCDKTSVEQPDPIIPPVDTLLTPVDTSVQIPVKGYLVDVISETVYTHEEFVKVFGDYLNRIVKSFLPSYADYAPGVIDMASSLQNTVLESHFAQEQYTTNPNWGIKRVIYRYKSVDHNGNECIATASAHYPCSRDYFFKHKIRSLASYANIFTPGPTHLCSASFPVSSGIVYQDALLVLTDYEGLDPNSDLRQNVFQGSVLARQQIDADLAALELLERDETTSMAEDYYTSNLGVSRGGMVALAMAKYIDTEAPKEIKDRLKVAGSYCATGPFIQEPVLNHMINDGINLSLLANLFSFFMTSSFRSAPELFTEWTVRDFFSEEFNSRKIAYNEKEYHLDEYAEIPNVNQTPLFLQLKDLGYNPRRMIAPDMLLADSTLNYSSPKVKALLQVVAKNNIVDGWTPKTPLRLAYCPTDEFIPGSVGEYAYSTLRKASNSTILNPVVTSHVLRVPDKEELGSHHNFSSLYYMMYLAVTPKPWLSGSFLPDLW